MALSNPFLKGIEQETTAPTTDTNDFNTIINILRVIAIYD